MPSVSGGAALPVHKEVHGWLRGGSKELNSGTLQEPVAPTVADVLKTLQHGYRQTFFDNARWMDEDDLDLSEGRFPRLRRCVKNLLSLLPVQVFIFVVVTTDMIMCLFILFKAEDKSPGMFTANVVILIILAIEILMRIIAHGDRFFKSYISVFEAVVVVVCILLVAFEAGVTGGIGRSVRPVLQVFRVLRRGVRVPIYVSQLRRRFESMIDAVIDDRIRALLSDWVYLPPENMICRVSHGHFRLEKVHILPEILQEMHFPFSVHGGFIEVLDIHMNVNFGLQQVFKNSKSGVTTITAHNVHLVVGSDPHSIHWDGNYDDAKYDKVLERKENLVEFAGRPVDMFAIKSAQKAVLVRNTERKAAKKAKRALSAEADAWTDLEIAANPVISRDSKRSGESDGSDDRDDDEGDGPVSILQDMSRIATDFSVEGEGAHKDDLKVPSMKRHKPKSRGQRLLRKVSDTGEALQEFVLKMKGQVKKQAQSAVLSQVQAVNLNMQNLSLRYEDTEHDRACAHGGLKVGAVCLRMERNDQRLLANTCDFRAASTWDSCRGPNTSSVDRPTPASSSVGSAVGRSTSSPVRGTSPAAAMRSAAASASSASIDSSVPSTPGTCGATLSKKSQSPPFDTWRLALQVERLSIWWDILDRAFLNTSCSNNIRSWAAAAAASGPSELVKLLSEPAMAARAYHRQEVLERLQISALRAAATHQAEKMEAAKSGCDAGPCSLSGDVQPPAWAVRQPKSELLCRWLPRSYLLVPTTISLHLARKIPVHEKGMKADKTSSTYASKPTGASVGTKQSATDANVEAAVENEMTDHLEETCEPTPSASSVNYPDVDVDIRVEDLVVRVDRKQMESLLRLRLYIKYWNRENELLQWRPVTPPSVDGLFMSPRISSTSANSGRSCAFSPLYEHVCADWWRYATIRVLRTVLPFNAKIPSKVVTALTMKRRSRIQVYLFLMFLKHFQHAAEIAEARTLKARLGVICRRLGLQRREELTVEHGKTTPGLPSTFQGVLRQEWDQKRETRCRKELQVALPLEVILECRYSAGRTVTQRILDADLKQRSAKHVVKVNDQAIRNSICNDSNMSKAQKVDKTVQVYKRHSSVINNASQIRCQVREFLWVTLDEVNVVRRSDTSASFEEPPAASKGISRDWLKMHFSNLKISLRPSVNNNVNNNNVSNNVHASRSIFSNVADVFTNHAGPLPQQQFHDAHRPPPPPCRRRFTRMRLSNITVCLCRSSPEDVRKALVPRVFEGSDPSSFGIKVSVGTFKFLWCQAPSGANALRVICCFVPGGDAGKDKEQIDNMAYVVQMSKHLKAGEDERARLKQEIIALQGFSQKVGDLQMQLQLLEEGNDEWRMHVKCSRFNALMNVPVVDDLKNMMMLVPPPHRPPFGLDPLGMKVRRWFLEMEYKQRGAGLAGEWNRRFRMASGTDVRSGPMASYWKCQFDWADDTHFARIRDYVKNKSFIIERVDLPSQRNEVVRWPCGGFASWEAFWPDTQGVPILIEKPPTEYTIDADEDAPPSREVTFTVQDSGNYEAPSGWSVCGKDCYRSMACPAELISVDQPHQLAVVVERLPGDKSRDIEGLSERDLPILSPRERHAPSSMPGPRRWARIFGADIDIVPYNDNGKMHYEEVDQRLFSHNGFKDKNYSRCGTFYSSKVACCSDKAEDDKQAKRSL